MVKYWGDKEWRDLFNVLGRINTFRSQLLLTVGRVVSVMILTSMFFCEGGGGAKIVTALSTFFHFVISYRMLIMLPSMPWFRDKDLFVLNYKKIVLYILFGNWFNCSSREWFDSTSNNIIFSWFCTKLLDVYTWGWMEYSSIIVFLVGWAIF